MRLRRRKFEFVGGVMWCPLHNGIADEISRDPQTCDLNYHEEECDLRDVFIEVRR